MNRYIAVLKDPDGSNPRYFQQFHSLRFGRSDRYSYSLTMQIPSKDLDLRILQPDMLIEVHRNDNASVSRLEGATCFFLRRWRAVVDSNGAELLELFARDSIYILSSRINAYPVDHSFASYDTYARNALALIVHRNMRSTVEVAEREIDGDYFATESGVTTGAKIKKACAWQDLKPLLDEIVNQSRNKGYWITYDVVYNGFFPLVFTTFADQRGNDLTSGIELSPANKNVTEPELLFDYEDETTAAYCLGGGEAEARIVGTANSDRVAVSPFSRRERKRENTQITIQTTADAEAEELLDKYRGKVYFTGKILQTESMRYGIDWNYGDKIRASWKGYTFDCRVEAYEVFYSNPSGTITDHVNATVKGEQWL